MKITKHMKTETKKFDPKKPVQTRDGKPVRIVCTDASGPYPIVAIIEEQRGDAYRYTAEGDLHLGHETGLDLLNVPEKFSRKVWVNVYPNRRTAGHATRERADRKACPDRIACIEITIEGQEGDGL